MVGSQLKKRNSMSTKTQERIKNDIVAACGNNSPWNNPLSIQMVDILQKYPDILEIRVYKTKDKRGRMVDGETWIREK